MFNYTKKSKSVLKAFTLIELLVVVAIISLLVSILLPSLQRAKDLAKNTLCMVNARNLGQALLIYANDNNGMFPEGSYYINSYLRFKNLYDTGYLEDPKILTCPTDISVSYPTFYGTNGKAIHASYKAESPQPYTDANGTIHWVSVPDCNSAYYKDHWGLDIKADLVMLLWDDNGYTHGAGDGTSVNAEGCSFGYVDGHVEFVRW